jgi:hypothetical protein
MPVKRPAQNPAKLQCERISSGAAASSQEGNYDIIRDTVESGEKRT